MPSFNDGLQATSASLPISVAYQKKLAAGRNAVCQWDVGRVLSGKWSFEKAPRINRHVVAQASN